jgi:predicted ATPase
VQGQVAKHLFGTVGCFMTSVAGQRIGNDDPIPALKRKFRAAVIDLVGTGPIYTQMIQGLRDLLALSPASPEPVDPRHVLATWRRFVEEIAARGPLVILLEDMGRVDDMMLKFVGDLAEFVGTLPLVVVTARSELTKRMTYWAGGRHDDPRTAVSIGHPHAAE